MSLSMTVSAFCTSFSMRVKRLWIALAVPMIFDRVLDANGAFSAASFAIAALVFGGCWLADHVVCLILKVVVSLFCEDSPRGLSFRKDSPRVVTPHEDSPREVTPRKETPCEDSLRGFFVMNPRGDCLFVNPPYTKCIVPFLAPSKLLRFCFG